MGNEEHRQAPHHHDGRRGGDRRRSGTDESVRHDDRECGEPEHDRGVLPSQGHQRTQSQGHEQRADGLREEVALAGHDADSEENHDGRERTRGGNPRHQTMQVIQLRPSGEEKSVGHGYPLISSAQRGIS